MNTLTHTERISPLWAKLKKHLASELDLLRRKNDRDHDAIRTADIRGRIAQIKDVLALGDEPKKDEEGREALVDE